MFKEKFFLQVNVITHIILPPIQERCDEVMNVNLCTQDIVLAGILFELDYILL